MDYPKSVPNVGLVNGKFVDEDTAAGVVGSLIPSAWGNAVTDEILNVINAAQIVPDEVSKTQMVDAIRTISGSVVGGSRGVKMSISGASASANLSADEVIVKTALGGKAWLLDNFNKTVNLGVLGAGGMDTGAAPANGFVAIYVIFNPTTKTAALLARNATSAVQPNIYGGASMPAGYTASALVSVWQTNASSQLVAGYQVDRQVSTYFITVLSTSAPQAAITALSIASAVPLNARKVSGGMLVASTSTTPNTSISLFASGAGVGVQGLNTSVAAAGGNSAPFRDLPIGNPQTIYYTATSSSGTPTFAINISAYEI